MMSLTCESEGGSAKRRCYSISLFSKMGHKEEGGVKNLKKLGDVIYGQPQINEFFSYSSIRESKYY